MISVCVCITYTDNYNTTGGDCDNADMDAFNNICDEIYNIIEDNSTDTGFDCDICISGVISVNSVGMLADIVCQLNNLNSLISNAVVKSKPQ